MSSGKDGMVAVEAEDARRAAGASTAGARRRGRFSAKRKVAAILRILRGESLDIVSREIGVGAATLSGWRDQFLGGGETSLKTRERDDRDDEIQRLRAKIGEITMDHELTLERCRRIEAGLPLVSGRRRV